MGKSKYTAEEKVELIKMFKHSGMSGDAFGLRHGISRASLRNWKTRYERDGLAGLAQIQGIKEYSLATKLNALAAYINNDGTLEQIALEYGIQSDSSLRKWIIDYNNGKPLANFAPRKQEPIIANKLTAKDRLDVVNFIKQDHSYQEAATKFHVSYQQARNWVQKFDQGGIEALEDKRGQRQPKHELSEVEQLRQEVQALKRQLEDQKTIELFLKKYNELQRRG